MTRHHSVPIRATCILLFGAGSSTSRINIMPLIKPSTHHPPRSSANINISLNEDADSLSRDLAPPLLHHPTYLPHPPTPPCLPSSLLSACAAGLFTASSLQLSLYISTSGRTRPAAWTQAGPFSRSLASALPPSSPPLNHTRMRGTRAVGNMTFWCWSASAYASGRGRGRRQEGLVCLSLRRYRRYLLTGKPGTARHRRRSSRHLHFHIPMAQAEGRGLKRAASLAAGAP